MRVINLLSKYYFNFKKFNFLGNKGIDVTNPSSSFGFCYCKKGKKIGVLKLINVSFKTINFHNYR
jgi:hypothetical protein